MNNLKNNFYPKVLVLLGFILFSSNAYAQLEISGSINLEALSGGNNSSFISNEIANEFRYPHVAVERLNAFLFAPINDRFYFEGRIQMDTWGTGRLNSPRLTLAKLTWDNPNKSYTISAGRFISPVGFYSRRQISMDRVFVALPLNYGYFVNISEQRGYWPQAGNTGTYTRADVGVSTIYFGGYSTGFSTKWEIKPDKLVLDAAVTNAAPASPADYTNLSNIALQSRLQYTPSIAWQLGLSLSHGGFMQVDQVNASVRQNNPLEQFRQTLVGADVTFGYSYFEIVSEIIYSHWKVPGFDSGFFDIRNGNKLVEYNVSNIGGNIDIKYEPPSLTGSYIAVRAEHLYFFEADDPSSTGKIKWDEDVTRLTGVLGYKLARNILAKFSFSEQTPFDGSKYALRLHLTAFF